MLALFATAGCSDRYEASFSTYADAKSRGALERGWLPEFLPDSATEIREEHDIDSNELWVTFNFGEEFQAPASCSPSVQRAALDDQGPRWWRQQIKALGSPIQHYECTATTELGGYWARSDCMLWTSSPTAVYRCSPSRLEPKPAEAWR